MKTATTTIDEGTQLRTSSAEAMARLTAAERKVEALAAEDAHLRRGSWASEREARRALRGWEKLREDLDDAREALDVERANARAAAAPLRAQIAEQVRRDARPIVTRLVECIGEFERLHAELTTLVERAGDEDLAACPPGDGAARRFTEFLLPVMGALAEYKMHLGVALSPPPPPALPADRVLLTCLHSFASMDGDLMRDEHGRIMASNIGLIGAEGAVIRMGETVGMKAEAAEILERLGFAEVAV